MNKKFSITFPQELYDQVKEFAESQGQTIATVIRESTTFRVEKGGIEEPSTGLGSNTQKLISTLESHNSTLTEQVRDLQKSLDQSQQLLAMQQKSLNTLAEQNQLLIETTQQKKPSFWQRLIGQKILTRESVKSGILQLSVDCFTSTNNKPNHNYLRFFLNNT